MDAIETNELPTPSEYLTCSSASTEGWPSTFTSAEEDRPTWGRGRVMAEKYKIMVSTTVMMLTMMISTMYEDRAGDLYPVLQQGHAGDVLEGDCLAQYSQGHAHRLLEEGVGELRR